MQRKKKVELRPTITVTKRDGEFTVEMEVFKKYSKERLVHQFPYEERPPLTYVIGKTEEEKKKLQKQREKRVRRETRRKSQFLQSTFRDKCQEICLKAYNQAIGMLPLPNPNDPDCPCITSPPIEKSPLDSCSCSEAEYISSSDTDNDEWVIEFSPPAAKWNPKAKNAPVLANNETQYTYLDYKVKLLDKSGNPVPRYFKSHEGKTECSDLGGFWGPGKVWLEINKDGYIGPDERWVPMNFIGPDGMFYSAEEGFITDSTGQVLKLGIDGYIDKDLKWVYYAKNKKQNPKSIATASSAKSPSPTSALQGKGDGKTKSASPIETLPASKSKSGGKKELAVSKKNGKKEKGHNPVVMRLMVHYPGRRSPRFHASKMRKSELDRKKLAKYCEIMGGIKMYDDIHELKPPVKTNRASNTPVKMYSRSRRPQMKLQLQKVQSNKNTFEQFI